MQNHEVVISGIAGTFPECENVEKLEGKIFSTENLVTPSEEKWKLGNHNMPAFSGKMKDTFLFDQTFFGIHRKLCIVMDAHCKHSIEKTYEALCDAGINPQDVYGKKVAVLMSSMTSETEYGSVMVSKNSGHAMLGHSRCMQSNRISYFFNFKGPSFTLDSSWIGPVQALEIATNLIAKGHIDMAVVGGSNILIYPQGSIHYDGLRKLNSDGITRPYSGDASGYSRSDGICVFVLQRASKALRSYGTVMKVLCSTEMTYPSVFADPVGFSNFLTDFYSDLPIDKTKIGYVEGDGAASVPLDAMELNGLTDVLCPGRKSPLLVGSCKSRLGHCESSAAMISIVNALMAFKTGYIPPCIHFTTPNPLVPALKDGRMKVVTEKTPFQGDYAAITAIGLSSIYSHVLIKKNPKNRPVREAEYFPADGIPRLFLISGRDENAMAAILTKISERTVDEGLYALNHNLFKNNFSKHLFRGYALVESGKKTTKVIPYQAGAKRPVWFVFSGMGSQWNEMGVGLMAIPTIRRSLERSHNVLLKKGIDLMNIITSQDPTIYDNILHAFVGIAAIQISLIDLLEELNVEADGMLGHSVGELGCSYADKCLTAEQTILAAYARGKASNEANLIKGMMAAVGKSYKDIKDELPEGIEVACHNSSTSCTLSGPAEIMEQYVSGLQKKGIFARLVNVANIAYHSKNIAPAAPYLLKYLKEIIPNPKPRSNKWISSSVPEDRWDSDLAKHCSAEYHTNNLLSYVLFEEASKHIPKDAVCIEIAPHGLLQAIVKKSLSTCAHVSLTNRAHKEGCSFLVEALGSLFTSGVQLDLSKLYPPVEFPVPRETDYLNVITWEHSEIWIPLALQYSTEAVPDYCWRIMPLNKTDEDYQIETCHSIRGPLYPQSKILDCVMEFSKSQAEAKSIKFKHYAFNDLKFHCDIPFASEENHSAAFLVPEGTGTFEVLYNEDVITTGQLVQATAPLPAPQINSEYVRGQANKIFVNEKQIYEYFAENGCNLDGPYRNIASITIFNNGFAGKLKWRGKADIFIDALFKLMEFYESVRVEQLMMLDHIHQFLFDPTELPEQNEDIEVFYDKHINYLACKGVRLLIYSCKPCAYKINDSLDLRNRQFISYSKLPEKYDFIDICSQLFRENATRRNACFQLIFEKNSKICSAISEQLNDKDLLSYYRITYRNKNSVSGVSMEKGAHDYYIIVSENDYEDNLNKLIDSDMPMYFIHAGNQAEFMKKVQYKRLTPVIEKQMYGRNIILYKKRVTNTENKVFITLDDNLNKKLKSSEIEASNKIYCFIYKYKLLSDVVDVLQTLMKDSTYNSRYFFIDDSSPHFDPKNAFYKEQLEKDMKVNITSKGSWGSIKDMRVRSDSVGPQDRWTIRTPLKNISCRDVNLSVLGLNLQSLVLPKKYKKFGPVDFSGMIGEDAVFGIGKITEDNSFEVDPHLCWKKPKEWTMEQAATVPLYYCMAYNILYVNGKYSNRPYESVFVHAGHTQFPQAVITVAAAMGLTIFTTCFNLKQKKYILDKFPQVDEKHVLLIDSNNRNTFVNHILDETGGEGVKIVIDCLEDNTVRTQTKDCMGYMGCCYLLTNNDMDTDCTYGMQAFLFETGIAGYNPELIFEMTDDEKLKMGSFLSYGIKTHVVRPFETSLINNNITRDEAAEIIVSKSHEDKPKKVIIPINLPETQVSQSEEIKAHINKSHYMIVGGYNSMWFDLMKWLITQGATSIHVVLNKEEIPQYLLKRFNNYMSLNKNISVMFIGTDKLNTAQSCNQFIKTFENGCTLNTVFYIKPGLEKQMTNFDYSLRTYSKSSSLVSIGLQPCRITEKRRCDGFKGSSFILMKSSIKNCTVVSVVDKWFIESEQKDDVILIDKAKPKEVVVDKVEDFLPSTPQELADICLCTSDKPTFTEIMTLSPPKTYARDLNAVFLFPGLKSTQTQRLASQFFYPTYMAKYPIVIKSIDEIASSFSKIILDKFDYEMFTLISEGWASLLILSIAKILEENGKLCELIFLDGSPSEIIHWNEYMEKSDNVLNKYIPTIKEDQKLTINNLKNWYGKMCESIWKEEQSDSYTLSEMREGFEALINRLEATQSFSTDNIILESTGHFFTSNDTRDAEQDILREVFTSSYYYHVLKPSPEKFLEKPALLSNVNNLPLHEYKMGAKKQIVKNIAIADTLDEESSPMYMMGNTRYVNRK